MDQQKQNKKMTEERRGAKGGGSVRQRPDGTWEARCTINGKRRSFYADKQSDALKAMRAAQKEKDDGEYTEPNNLTVGQWMDIWLEEYSRPKIKPTTYQARRYRIEGHIKPFLGKIKLRTLDTTQVQRYYNYLLDTKKIKPSVIAIHHANLTTAMKQAVKLRYIKINPCEACTLPRTVKKEITPFSETELKKFLATIKGDQFENLFLVTLFTGMRMGEVCGLSWDSIDFLNGTITVKQQLLRVNLQTLYEKYYIGSTKNGKERILTPPRFVMELLKKVRSEQVRNHLNVGLAWKNKWDLVFVDSVGEFYQHGRVGRHFKKVVRRIGRPDLRFHDLRHTYAMTALQEGDSPKTVQQALGHSTADFTMNVYAHVSEKMKKESAARMQSYYEKIKA